MKKKASETTNELADLTVEDAPRTDQDQMASGEEEEESHGENSNSDPSFITGSLTKKKQQYMT